MSENQQIHEFACRLGRLFRDPGTPERDLDTALAEDCRKLGFRMDCGQAFREAFGEETFYRAEALEQAADRIGDPELLGSAIYSRWRYITHWAQSDLSQEENRRWFCLALDRLAAITGESWQTIWERQAMEAEPALREFMLKSLQDYRKLYPED